MWLAIHDGAMGITALENEKEAGTQTTEPVVMSQSIPTRYIPREIFFGERIQATPCIFLFNSLPPRGAKNDNRIPGGGGKCSRTRRNGFLSLQKSLKIKKTTRQYKFFIWRT